MYTYITITPVAAIVLTIGSVVMLFGPRRVVIPVILLLCTFLSMRQRFGVMGLDFMMHRIVLCVGWLRLVLRDGLRREMKWGALDTLMILLFVWETAAYTIVHSTVEAFVNRMGRLVDGLGFYFLYRNLIREKEEIPYLSRALGWVCALLAAVMAVEFVSGKNPLAVVGGVRTFVQAREGIPRCQGAFGHPITAGTFGATLFPLFVMLSYQRMIKSRRAAMVGCVASIVVTICSGSSGPVVTYLAGIAGLLLWPLRRKMRVVRWIAAVGIGMIQLVMDAPIWALIFRVSVFPGSTAYHRYRLIDVFVRRFKEWWAFGAESTDHWGYYMFDITNQYVARGITGGVLSMIIFLALLFVAFREFGRGLRRLSDASANSKLVWGIGSMFFAHCAAFVGVAYWDQVVVLWYLVLAFTAEIPLITGAEMVQKSGESGKFCGTGGQ